MSTLMEDDIKRWTAKFAITDAKPVAFNKHNKKATRVLNVYQHW